MNKNLIIHHCAKRIAPDSLEFIMDLFKALGCEESYWEPGARWAMVEQPGNHTILQFIETDQVPQATADKQNSHIAFISGEPLNEINRLKNWADKRNMKMVVGKWSEKELYFDCPDVFIDFVIEIMHKSILET